MAVTRMQAGPIQTRLIALMRSHEDLSNPDAITSAWWARNDFADGITYNDIRGMGRSAAASVRLARALNPLTARGRSPRAGEVPIDRSIQSHDPRYLWRVVVRMVGTNGRRVESTVFVRTDLRLTADEAAARAARIMERGLPEGHDYRGAIRGVGENPTVTTHIVGLGQFVSAR